MKRKLIARPRADLDIIKHIVNLSEVSPSLAARFKQSVKAAFGAIAKSPRSCATAQIPGLQDVIQTSGRVQELLDLLSSCRRRGLRPARAA